MSIQKSKLTEAEIVQAFRDGRDERWAAILSARSLADLLGVSIKTIYDWVAKGRLEGAYRKRGKHLLFWRDRAIKQIFNGPNWR